MQRKIVIVKNDYLIFNVLANFNWKLMTEIINNICFTCQTSALIMIFMLPKVQLLPAPVFFNCQGSIQMSKRLEYIETIHREKIEKMHLEF